MKTLHLPIIFGILLAAIALMFTAYIIQQHPQERLDVKSPPQPQNIDTYWSANMTKEIVMSRWDSKAVPVQILSKQDEPLNIKLGLSVPNKEGEFIQTGDSKLPFGMFANLDKKMIDLNATTQKGYGVRDTVKLTVTTLPIISPGTYKVGLVLYQDDGKGSSSYLTIKVE